LDAQTNPIFQAPHSLDNLTVQPYGEEKKMIIAKNVFQQLRWEVTIITSFS
jgi:hypothetical protein